jgi:hypothetical protein
MNIDRALRSPSPGGEGHVEWTQDLRSVPGQVPFGFLHVFLVSLSPDQLLGRCAQASPFGQQEDVAHQPAGEGVIRPVTAQKPFDHAESVSGPASPEQVYTWTLGVVRNRLQGREFLDEQPASVGGQQLLKGHRGGRIAVGGGEGVVHVAVEQRCQASDQVHAAHLIGRKAAAVLEGGHFFGQVAEIVQQENLTASQRFDAGHGSRACEIFYEAHFLAEGSRHDFGVLAQADQGSVVRGVSLVRHDYEPGPPIRKLSNGRDAFSNARVIGDPARAHVDRRIDIHSQKNAFFPKISFLQRPYG